jgi:hypothetical protein
MDRCRHGVGAFVLLLMSAVASAQTSSVNGRVTTKQGGAVADAEVTLVAPPGPAMPGMPAMRMPPASPDRTVRSRADGTFVLDQVPAGRWVLQVDAPGLARSSQEIAVPTQQTFAVTLEALEISGGDTAPGTPAASGAVDAQALLDRIKVLEQRILDLEASTVLSEPVTRVKRIEVWVDSNGNQYDHEVPGAKRTVTYQRERVYRRENINEKLEEALADAEQRNVKIGVSAATVTQLSRRTRGDATTAKGHAYELASADLFFTAGLAQNTVFFADVVGLSGSPPDAEIPSTTLLNSYTARLVRQNELNLREAWVRTEVFSQKLALVAGRLDLTNFFDHNAAANDETTQFISDALVNNPVLGLASNGAGVAAVFDPKIGVNFKVGIQQSNPDATNLSQSVYSLAEVGYVARPPSLGEGNYRVWFRTDNSTQRRINAIGVSIDQKLVPTVSLFARYGNGRVNAATSEETTRSSTGHHFYSGGLQFQNGLVFNPLDTWGLGYAQTQNAIGQNEKLVEGYYNFRLTERLRLSFHLQHVVDSGGETSKFGYLLPGVRLQASF